jgi:hypothetical protein
MFFARKGRNRPFAPIFLQDADDADETGEFCELTLVLYQGL